MYGGMGAYPEDGSWWKRERFNFDIGYEQALFGGFFDIRLWKNYAEREAYNTRKSLNRVFHKKWFMINPMEWMVLIKLHSAVMI